MAQLFDAFGPYVGPMMGSAEMYSMHRRQRDRMLAMGAFSPEDAGAIVGAETAAFGQMSEPTRTILIGVATGAATYVVTRLIDRLVFGGRK